MAYELQNRIELLAQAFAQIEGLPLDRETVKDICTRLMLTDTAVLRDIVESGCIQGCLDQIVKETSPYVQ